MTFSAVAGPRSWSAVPVCMCRPWSTTSPFPEPIPSCGRESNRRSSEAGPTAAHARLAALDPVAAAAILPWNGRRIARALEVIELTGQPFSATMPVPGAPRFDAAMIGLDLDTGALDARLAARVDAMVAAGFLDEVRGLLDRGLRDGRTARRALGYPQLIEVLDGRSELTAAVTATVAATRRFVRRQRSWFRRDRRLRWLDALTPRVRRPGPGGRSGHRRLGR